MRNISFFYLNQYYFLLIFYYNLRKIMVSQPNSQRKKENYDTL